MLAGLRQDNHTRRFAAREDRFGEGDLGEQLARRVVVAFATTKHGLLFGALGLDARQPEAEFDP
ncbi:hypothetical protein LB553_00130 [Mesorhizobium sp. CA8]|uniref:hypothetical protein n=1 Tax=unclassified Mesorhizobium TaxID=325217 RepID=UPI001CCD8934|nr:MULTISPECIES: hypothetical protein [unclassified Mesorhizobium]MBZ9759297.1 hypothetical protein [Mesorhizobium sp. CA8]MBZ9821689.1 hypothetical protein [Mesorhizobium sp. CA4]